MKLFAGPLKKRTQLRTKLEDTIAEYLFEIVNTCVKIIVLHHLIPASRARSR
jgi:hypothetical protein